MSGEEVGPRIEVPFPVMTDAGFPHGLRCDACHRLITEGQPYREDVEGVYDNGDTISLLRCVYCPAAASSLEPRETTNG
jgi:ferredoxin